MKFSCPWVCNGFACGRQYASKFGNGALKHFHAHLKDVRCKDDLKEIMLDYAKEHKIMKVLKKRGYIRTQVVAA